MDSHAILGDAQASLLTLTTNPCRSAHLPVSGFQVAAHGAFVM
jgi:hypothetical protein